MRKALSARHSVHGKPGSTTISQNKKNQTKTHPNNRKLPPLSQRSPRMRFPEAQGKTLEWVELWIEDDDDSYLELRFPDQTALVFVLKQPQAGVDVEAAYGAWKRGNWRQIREY